MSDFDQKEGIKGEKYITPMEFAEHIRKSDISENSKIFLWSTPTKWTS